MARSRAGWRPTGSSRPGPTTRKRSETSTSRWSRTARWARKPRSSSPRCWPSLAARTSRRTRSPSRSRTSSRTGTSSSTAPTSRNCPAHGTTCRPSSASRPTRAGYCQYYASTMAIFLRELGIPTRLVEGYLPGTRDPRTGIETLLEKDRHDWVEVYFPGYGWVPFDPTGGQRRRSSNHWRPASRPPATRPSRPGAAGRPRRVGPPRTARDERCRRRRRAVGGQGPRRGPARRDRRAAAGRRGRDRVHRLATRAARRDLAGSGVRHGHPDRLEAGLRSQAQPDRLRVRRRAGRGPARRAAGPRDRGPGEGRVHVRSDGDRWRSSPGAPRRRATPAGEPAAPRLPTRHAAPS